MENGQLPGVRQLRYAPASDSGLGVEVLSFDRLRRMDRARRRTKPQRPDFHVLALVRAGSGRHTADFVDYPLHERTVVWIRPGVVHRWADVEHVDGALILFEQGFLPEPGPAARAAADVFAPACWQVHRDSWQLAVTATDHLALEHSAVAEGQPAASVPILAHLLAALVLRLLPQLDSPPAAHQPDREVFHRYRAAVEHRFTEHHHVIDYARTLGYAQRTLTRATRAAAGVGAKQFLDQRILLEAKRLLAHTDLPVNRCAQRLGFDDPANFTTFFQRHTGTPPGRWRAEHGGR